MSTESGYRYTFKPKLDITAYELALCVPVLLLHRTPYSQSKAIEKLPPEVRRHFVKEVSPN